MDQRHIKILVNFGPQSADMNINNIGLGIKMIIPDVLEQHRSGNNLPLVAHQEFEKFEIAWLQRDLLVAPFDFPRQQIHMQVGDTQRRFCFCFALRSPGQGIKPCFKFAERERLDEVIISAGLQSLDPVVDLSESA